MKRFPVPSVKEVNEETLKNTVLVPYLLSLGLSVDQLSFEHEFRVRIGRNDRTVGSGAARGRADVVVRNPDGQNLFVVELKATQEELTVDDRDQAISYARLLRDIAPFVIVSNGNVSKIYDSITCEELRAEDFHETSKFYSSGRKLLSTVDMQIRWEALEHFVGYSSENVSAFTRAQTESRIKPLLGRNDDGKYVPSLYVRREPLREAFAEFLETSSSIFVLLGESGVGKTNEMCSLAESLGSAHLTLFFAGSALSEGVGQALLDEFNWGFSQQLELPELVRRLERLSKAAGTPVLIFLDAADEMDDVEAVTRISEFVRHLGGTEGAVRLVVSLKLSEWGRFAKRRDIPTELAVAVEDERSNSEGQNDTTWKRGTPYLLGEFSEAELGAAVAKYEAHFRLLTLPEGELRAICRLPFFLRVVGEVYDNGHEPIPQRISGSKLAERWLELKFAKMTAPPRARRDMIRVASVVYEQASRRPLSETVLIDHVQESELGNDLLEEDLVTYDVLVRVRDNHGRPAFRFYHGQILYYTIARLVLKLDTLTSEVFGRALPQLLSSPILQGALFWHLNDGASPEHMQVMTRELNARAALFLTTYCELLERVMPGLIGRIPPQTTALLGVAYIRERHGVNYYGLFPVQSTSHRRVVELSDIECEDIDPFEALRKIGCPNPVGNTGNFAHKDPREFAAELAFEQLRTAIKRGSLDESAYMPLLEEAVLAICSEHAKRLGLSASSDRRLRIASLLPLDLKEVSWRVQVCFGMSQAEVKWMNEQERTRSEYFTPGPAGGGSLNMGGFRREEVEKEIIAAAQSGKRFLSVRFHGASELAVLPSILVALAEKGVYVISTAPSPLPDRTPRNYWSAIAPYSDVGLTSLLKNVFSEGLIAYQRLVERNFPRLKASLNFFSKGPLAAVASFKRDPEGPPHHYLGHMVWALFTCREASDALAWVTTDPPPSEFFDLDTKMPRIALPEGVLLKQVHRSSGDLTHVVFPTWAVGFGGNDRDASARYAPIRAFAYMLLAKDMEKLNSKDLLAAASLIPQADERQRGRGALTQ